MPSQVRTSFMRQISALCENLGLAPAALADEVGLPPDAFLDPDQKVSGAALGRLIELAAARSGAKDFGLRLGAMRGLEDWGLMGLAAREKATLGEYLEVLSGHARYQNDAMHCPLVRVGGHVEFRMSFGETEPALLRHSLEMSAAVHVRCLRQVMGDEMAPAYVTFRHARIGDLAAYRTHLGGVPFFEAEHLAVGYALDALDRPLAAKRPPPGQTLDRLLRKETPAHHARYAEAVAQNLRALIGVMDCSIDQMARLFGLTARTLQRKLGDEGLTYSQIMDQVRSDMAAEYIEGSTRPMAEVSDILGFKSQSALAHWHRSRHGESPLERRRRARVG